LFTCEAYTIAISTLCDALAVFATKTPPRSVCELHTVSTGTMVAPPVCGQKPIGLPACIAWILVATKPLMARVITSAAFFAAATSAVVEFGAGKRSGFAQVPAPGALSFWSPR
jgi:hypothetical protein